MAEQTVLTREATLALAGLLNAVGEHIQSHDCEAHCEPGGCDISKAGIHLSRLIVDGKGVEKQPI